jgi:NADPH:quinone reductase-like Zn-dependent oxidoreductase
VPSAISPGAVGALVGQIAKHKFGCRVIGTTGGAEKAAYLTDALGFDDERGSVPKQISEACDLFPEIHDASGGGVLGDENQKCKEGNGKGF